MSKTTTLGEVQLTQSPHDVVTAELIQPDDMPPIVKIGWPLQPTVIDPERFRDLAAVIVRLFSEAHITLAQSGRGGGCDRTDRRQGYPGHVPPPW